MMSHYLNKIYAHQVLQESVLNDDIKQQMLQAAGSEAWWIKMRLEKLQKLFSDDASLLDSSLSTYTSDALEYGTRMYKNLQEQVARSLKKEDALLYPWSTTSDMINYMKACERMQEKQAPVALQWFERCKQMMEDYGNDWIERAQYFEAGKDLWVRVTSSIIMNYTERVSRGKRVPAFEQMMNSMLQEYVQCADERKRMVFDKVFGDAMFVVYVREIHERWPEFESVINQLPDAAKQWSKSPLSQAVYRYKQKFEHLMQPNKASASSWLDDIKI